ncbi:MAG: purine-nucleoside phosphorylase [Sphingobacteriales bacterium 17-39-43]|uniref:purine-nucleoside phosphorylase n=1 Tax=Daejeonella sp. TaxID=2805397 RepID=UPI000BD4AE0E|nr:purine-nucleoside phosphorylase [Daejeonella sp.]OYZ31338.1 MAG: purine-nucleoside phosphorylase [Sphingobacteriales bacterium 16-39-50]OYZ45575.1 MAG: purine-nucleoside phosphorylase [Sphingobacteriales bacterium 24-40-4]OZA24324.1 MAG: purine-nucleoside phosphorylase [Sphingobacteriales bacterium 17-39-43]OZA58959.1 MAG: purine-nucleoside phosphorylase [Sphingobacteriales bacterium 39-40-5]HQS05920.1 purine-nucleoside phosphorylase [Daejeonella sp.]
MHQNLQATTDYIKKKIGDFEPEIGIILGTGLGGLVEDIEILNSLMYSNIPNFPISTLEFHSGKLIFGMLSGKKVVAMQGRLHYYEGYDMKQITFPVRVMKMLGIQKLFVSNASGALNPEYRKGDLMIIHDHINMQSDNPLRGRNTASLGPRFPDMSEPYDRSMIEKGMEIAHKNNIRCHSGVYVSVNGPNLETRAEYRFLRLIGADSVGMSTVPEVIVANHMALPVFAISVLTDEGFPDTLKVVSLEEILKTAEEAEPKMTKILKDLILEI